MLVLAFTVFAERADQRLITFNIEPQPLTEALSEWAQQANLQLISPAGELTDRLTAPRVTGALTAEAALKALLAETPLAFEFVNERTVAIRKRVSEGQTEEANLNPGGSQLIRVARLDSPEHLEAGLGSEDGLPGGLRKENVTQAEPKGIPEVLVVGSRILNTDIRRTRDDAQPYVVFDRTFISQSGATSVNDFLRQRLPMNTTALSGAQRSSVAGNRSEINLRGLGSNQTLILIDGRRAAGVSAGGPPAQPDINGIPLAAVERIEILPSTASGIYGGSATGGVINVILRRDYSGAEVGLTYENTFAGGSALQRIDFGTGFTFNEGATSVLLAGSYSQQDELLAGERKLQRRGLAKVLANNPAFAVTAAPPLAATTNVRSVDGTDLVLDTGTSLNSPLAHVPSGYAGVASDGGAGLVSSATAYNTELADSAQMNGGRERALLTEPTLRSVQGTLRHRFGPNIEVFIDGSGSVNLSRSRISGVDLGPSFRGITLAADAPTNPFQQAIQVTVPSGVADGIYEVDARARRIAIGANIALSEGWAVGADYTWNRSSIEQSQPRLGAAGAASIRNGLIDVLRDPALYEADLRPFVQRYETSPFRSTTLDGNVRLSGPLWSLPGGDVVLTALVEHREDQIGDGTGREFLVPMPGAPPVETARLLERTQTVDSAYLELRLPVFSERNAVPGIQELELQLAGRHDRYETDWSQSRVTPGTTAPVMKGRSKLDSTDPTIGVRYKISRDLMFRASYGTGFLPPSVADFDPVGPFDFGDVVVDPLRGNEVTFVTATFGGNPDLRPEQSRSWSTGLVLTPRFWPGLRFAVDYTRIDKTDNVRMLTGQQIVDNESFLADRITRAEPTPGDPFGVGPIIAIDETSMNIARARIEAFDLAIDYGWETLRFGAFDLSAIATVQTAFDTQLLPVAPVVEEVGITSNAPLKLKGNATLRWRSGNWTVGWTARYYDSYVVSTNETIVLNQGSRTVPSQMYHDLFASWRVESASAFVSALELQAGIKNVLDEEPPFDAANSSFGYYSPYGDPRLSSWYLGVKATFH